jgi:hypothetical protein
MSPWFDPNKVAYGELQGHFRWPSFPLSGLIAQVLTWIQNWRALIILFHLRFNFKSLLDKKVGLKSQSYLPMFTSGMFGFVMPVWISAILRLWSCDGVIIVYGACPVTSSSDGPWLKRTELASCISGSSGFLLVGVGKELWCYGLMIAWKVRWSILNIDETSGSWFL